MANKFSVTSCTYKYASVQWAPTFVFAMPFNSFIYAVSGANVISNLRLANKVVLQTTKGKKLKP